MDGEDENTEIERKRFFQVQEGKRNGVIYLW